MMADMVFHESIDGGADRKITGKYGKSKLECVYIPVRKNPDPFIMKRSIISNLPPSVAGTSGEMVPYLGLRICLFIGIVDTQH